MTFALRDAVLEDAEQLARLHTQIHEECYSRLLPESFFAERRATLPKRIAGYRERLEAGQRIVVATDDAGLVGLASGGETRDEDAPTALELYMIYIFNRAHGTGVAQALLSEVIGAEAAYLWVLEDNPRAQAFYQKNGFRADGKREVLPAAWSNLPEIRMTRSAQK